MPIEIEKKYRLTKRQRQSIERRLREMGAASRPLEFEENTLYRGGRLDIGNCILRLRRVNQQRFFLTFKQRLRTKSAIKHQQEEETEVANGDAMHAILTELGYHRGLVYEKTSSALECRRSQSGDRRTTVRAVHGNRSVGEGNQARREIA